MEFFAVCYLLFKIEVFKNSGRMEVKMKEILMTLILIFCSAVILSSEEKKQEKTFEADKGSDTIDVSNYPKEMQENYKVFAKKCSKCHTLARPINSDFKSEEWNMYVKRMMRKPDSGISPSTGKKIYEFLKYYLELKEKNKEEKKEEEKSE